MSASGVVQIRAAGRVSNATNLSTIIDGKCFHQLETGVRRDQRVQVDHRAVFPQERAHCVGNTGERLAHDLASRINGKGLTEAIPAQDSEIGDDTLAPKVGIAYPNWKTFQAHNLPGVVDCVCGNDRPVALCGKVKELPLIPKKRMGYLVPRQRRQPDDLASVVQIINANSGKECAKAPKRAEVFHLALTP